MFDVRLEGDKQLVIYLNNLKGGIKKESLKALITISEYLQLKVRDRLGSYHSSWPKLKRESVIAKYRKRGGAKSVSVGGRKASSFGLGADDPLVLFSRLKNSISREVNYGALEAVVYSDEVYAAVHEYGYKQVPARSYMRTTLDDETDHVIKIVNDHLSKLI